MLFLMFRNTCMISCKQSTCIFIEITSRSILTIIFDNQNPLTWTVTNHMSKALAPVTLNLPSSSCRCN